MPVIEELAQRLCDKRSKKVVFLSHCLLNENTRYLGGACRGGCVREVVEPLIRENVGIVQMPCPEQQAWGGVLKHLLLAIYGAKAKLLLYRFRWLVLPLFIWYTKCRYRRMARAIARQVDDYIRSGFSVLAIVGVDGSPSCGVRATLDMRRAFELLAGIELASITTREINAVIRECQVSGAGFFTEVLQKEIKRMQKKITYQAHDLIAELDHHSDCVIECSPRPSQP